MTKSSISLQNDFVQIIDGKPAPTNKTRRGVNPANLEEKAEVPLSTQEDLDRAVAAAKKAFKSWSNTPYEERRRQVLAYADAIDCLRVEFRDMLTAEQGKPVSSPNTVALHLTKQMIDP